MLILVLRITTLVLVSFKCMTNPLQQLVIYISYTSFKVSTHLVVLV